MATAAEIRNRAAHDLGKTRLGGSLQSQDQTRIDSGYSEVYAQLKDKGLATWAFAGEVPNAVVPYVSGLIALNCMLTFNISQERKNTIYEQVGVDGTLGYNKIHQLVTPEYESTEDKEDF